MSSIVNQFKDFIKQHKYDIKDHQLEGFEWCYNRETSTELSRGGLLCDEMGLGKTLMMISCMKLNPMKNTLLVVPKSLIGQWKEKITLLLGKKPKLFHGIYAKSFIENAELDEQIEWLSKNVYITTYGMLNSVLNKVTWERIIYDEAHNMREQKTKVFKNALKINGKIKWMVTGTPIQNKWDDVVTLCKLLNFPGTDTAFAKGSSTSIQRDFIQKFMLIRTTKQVKIKMPKLKVEIIKVAPKSKDEKSLMTDIHSMLLCTKVNKTLDFPLVNKMSTSHLAYLIRAKQSCSHSKMVEKSLLKNCENREDSMPDFTSIGTSKLTQLIKTIESHDKKVKKLIFYTFNQEKAFIEKMLKAKNFKVGVVNGKISIKNKNKIVKSLDYDVLLVQIKAGSDGLNLQQYGEVYFVSPHWNPAVEKQAIARIYRIGQLALKVNVYYLISTFDIKNSYTLDEYCMEIKRNKQEQIDFLFKDSDLK